MADAAICSQISAFLTPKFASRRFRLRFTYNGRMYTTVFTAEHDDTELRIKNPTCIDIAYIYDDLSFVTNLLADISEEACFTPRLVSNARGAAARTTTMDLLAVLMTKLCLCFPSTVVGDAPVAITDMAEKDGINLSAFHLIRGGQAIYEKYGYVSPSVQALRQRISTMSWGGLIQSAKELILMVYKENGFRAVIRNDDMLINIVKPITFEIERDFNQRHMGDPASGGSDDLNFSEFMIIYLTAGTLYNNEFVLNMGSSEWLNWSSRLILTDFTLLDGANGGRRGNTRRTRRRWRSARSKVHRRLLL